MGTTSNTPGAPKLQSRGTVVIEPLRILTVTLLSLLLPLSFLVLARITTARYLCDFTTSPPPPPQPSSLFISPLLHVLVPLVSVATLVHGLTSRITSGPSEPMFRPRLYCLWIFLCTVQVCVFLGIEGSIAADVSGSGFGHEKSFLSRVVFFLGLHETMVHWSRVVVKPVVDDAVIGQARKEWRVERLVMAASFGTLWWGRLRDEAESLVAGAEIRKGLLMDVGLADFIGWWLYYLTMAIGVIRVVKSIVWIGMVVLCRRRVVLGESQRVDDEKVSELELDQSV